MRENHSRLFKELILKSWWAIFFILLCFFAYDQTIKRRNREESKLRSQFEELSQKKKEALALQEELKEQIASQSDEAWIEMILMRCMGLVPEGQTKVHFIPILGLALLPNGHEISQLGDPIDDNGQATIYFLFGSKTA